MSRTRFTVHTASAAILALTAFLAFAGIRPVLAQTDLNKDISTLNEQVKKKKTDLKELERKANEYRSVIAQKKDQAASLEAQLALLDNRIAKTQLSIDIARGEVRALELEISAVDGQILDQEKRVGHERQLLAALARKLYRTENSRTPFEVLISHRSFSDFFDALRAVISFQQGVSHTLANITRLQNELKYERSVREDKQLAVAARKRELEVAVAQLEDERALKDAIITETKSSELHYRYLLAELRDEQAEADSEILNLEKSLRDKMAIADRLSGENAVLSWPVAPTRGISAMFHDSDYPFRYVFEHPGIDIRTYQGTPVRAAAAGVIGRAKNAGMGYNYVMILHPNDVSTVYGHLSRIVAREQAFVERGEIIGYSGGMPGTPGAGKLTTGPHLHFETRYKGLPADPLSYLVAY